MTLLSIAFVTLLAAGCHPAGMVGGGGGGGDGEGQGGGGATLRPFITDGQLDSGHPTVGQVKSQSGLCTGTLVGRRTVVTAGHCIKPGEMSFLTEWQTYHAVQEVVHPGYDKTALKNDIAVLILDRDVTGVQPTPIATSAPQLNEVVVLVGFGKTSGLASDSGTKRKGTNTISKLTSTTLYYHGTGGGVSGTCNGDSGGPAFTLRGGREVLAGVTSWGDQLCQQYGVDTRVDAYKGWIAQVAGQDLQLESGGGASPAGNGGQSAGGAQQSPAGEGQSCAGKPCATGLACVAVYAGIQQLGQFCMEQCLNQGSDPICDGAEVCTPWQSKIKVCFAAGNTGSGYTNVAP
jgi:hypothetical protein